MDTLELSGLEFYGYHGTESWEKEVGRRFIVDVTLRLDLEPAGRSDRLEDVLDYRRVYEAVRDVVAGESHDLLERVAWRVLEELLWRFAAVKEVRVRVEKPAAPIGGLNAGAAVLFVRGR